VRYERFVISKIGESSRKRKLNISFEKKIGKGEKGREVGIVQQEDGGGWS